ncbi:MAG: hypothetical protein GXY37_02150 [Chloroflexi bacterium]|nr:hypothetical protein [Chloroflexota bacterium]
MNQLVRNSFWSFLGPMAKQVADPHGDARLKKKPPKVDEVKLSFETQRMLAAKSAEEIGEIILNASPTEEMSYQPTVPVAVRTANAFENFTVQTQLTIKYFKRSQAFTLFMTSLMGFVIGVFIGIFI